MYKYHKMKYSTWVNTPIVTFSCQKQRLFFVFFRSPAQYLCPLIADASVSGSFEWHVKCVCVCLQTAERWCWLAPIKLCWLHSECHKVVRLQMTHGLTLYRASWWCTTINVSQSLSLSLSEWWTEHHENMWLSWRSIIPHGSPWTPTPSTPPSNRAWLKRRMRRTEIQGDKWI